VGGILQALNINGTFVAQIVDFILLFLFMRYFVWPPLSRALEERRERVRREMEAAEREREQAEADRRAQEQALAQARAEAQAILERAERTAAEQARALVAEARAQAERLERQVQEEIRREREAAMAALRNEVAELVLEATRKLLRARVDREEDRRLVESFISDAVETTGAGVER
jgi:F-type H+-transporting ATPase subunit b